MEAVQREIQRFQKKAGKSQSNIPMHNRKATMDTILKRNNSNTVMRKHGVPFH